MNAITILPTNYLKLIKQHKSHMSLMQCMRAYPEYRKFYQKLIADPEKFVIMDNGAAEGEQPTTEEWIECALEYQPDEVILPDTLFNMEDTLRRGEAALAALGKWEHNLMAVPQGNNIQEWSQCAIRMIDNWPITTIGVTKFMTSKFKATARLEGVLMIERHLKQTGKRLHIHLLGCHLNVGELAIIEQTFPGLVRSVDSAFPFIFTKMGAVVSPSVNRDPKVHINFQYDRCHNKQLLLKNIEFWRRAPYDM